MLRQFPTSRHATTGVTLTLSSGAATTCQLLPLNSNGNEPRTVRVKVDAGLSGTPQVGFIKFSGNAVGTGTAALTTDCMVSSYDPPQFFETKGLSFFSAIALAQTPRMNIVAVED